MKILEKMNEELFEKIAMICGSIFMVSVVAVMVVGALRLCGYILFGV